MYVGNLHTDLLSMLKLQMEYCCHEPYLLDNNPQHTINRQNGQVSVWWPIHYLRKVVKVSSLLTSATHVIPSAVSVCTKPVRVQFPQMHELHSPSCRPWRHCTWRRCWGRPSRCSSRSWGPASRATRRKSWNRTNMLHVYRKWQCGPSKSGI